MRQAGVPKRRGERGGDRDEHQRAEDGAGGEYSSGVAGRILGGADAQIDVACQGGEGGLDGVEEDGVGEAFGRGGGAVGGCCYAFLEEGP